jgi:hypothetical protein
MFDGLDKDTTIPMDEDHVTIATILKVLYGRPIRNISGAECTTILEVADKYEFLHVANCIALYSRTLLKEDMQSGWDVLKIAARFKDDDLAKSAVKHLTTQLKPTLWPSSWVNAIGVDYFCAIIRAYDDDPVAVPRWSSIGDRFDVEAVR